MAKNDLLNQRLQEIQKDKEEADKNKPGVMQTIATGEEEKPDFMKMAEELESQKELKSENDGYIKDTIYIREDLYRAMQAICTRQGDKKKRVNESYEQYLTKVYKDMNIDK